MSQHGKHTELSRGLHLKADRIVVGSQEQERNTVIVPPRCRWGV